MGRYTINNPADTINNPSDTTNYSKDSTYYHYLVYSANGTPFKQIKAQDNEINDQLPAGSYYISIVASNKPHLIYGGFNFQRNNYFSDFVYYPTAYYNTFAYTVDSTSSNSVATKSVVLDKMWGEVELNILDKASCYLPADVKSISVKIEGQSSSFLINNQKGISSDSSALYTYTDISKFRSSQESTYRFTSYPIENKTADIYLIINYNNKPSTTLSIASVNVKKGVKSILKGNLGNVLKEEENGHNINLVLNEDWKNEIINF